MSHQMSRVINAAGIIGRVADARRRRKFAKATASMSSHELMDIGFVRDYRGALQKLPSDWE